MINTSIIIVNWNGLKHLPVCLNSLRRQSYKNFEIIMVDNGSTDGSTDFVRKNFPEVIIIQAKKNHGFAEGNNIGIREAFKDKNIKYVVALNNDTEVEKNWLENLISVAELDHLIGAVASKTLFFDKHEIIDSAGDYLKPGTLKAVTRGYQEEDKGQYDKIEECFSARAAACLYRREMLEDIKIKNEFFDKKYFAYIEDTDLSIRARLRGWKIMYNPQAVVYHKVAATSGRIAREFRRYYSGRNRIFTAIKNYPSGIWLLAVKGRESVDYDYQLPFLLEWKIYVKICLSMAFSLPRLITQRTAIQRNKKLSAGEIKNWIDQFRLNKI